MQINAAAERLRTTIRLLSLDRVVPYFTAMGLTISQQSAQPIKECIRQAIEANRQQFTTDQHAVPDLAAHVTAAFDRRFGTPGRLALFRWLAEDFIHSAADRASFVGWHILLSLACRDPSRWSALGLPASISEQSRRHLIGAIDTSDIEEIEDALENLPLSAWDAQMYLITALATRTMTLACVLSCGCVKPCRTIAFVNIFDGFAASFPSPTVRHFFSQRVR